MLNRERGRERKGGRTVPWRLLKAGGPLYGRWAVNASFLTFLLPGAGCPCWLPGQRTRWRWDWGCTAWCRKWPDLLSRHHLTSEQRRDTIGWESDQTIKKTWMRRNRNNNNINITVLFLPGLLMYMWMGLLLLSDCRKSSWAMTRLATESSIWAGTGR